MKYLKVILLGTILSFVWCVFAHAETSKLPDMLVGQTTVDVEGINYYGGMAGNFAVYNANKPSDEYGLESSMLGLSGECQGIFTLTTPSTCFLFGNYLGGALASNFAQMPGRLLTSRTSVTVGGMESELLETPALFYGQKIVSGDTSTGVPLSNFAYWGRNLAQSSGTLNSDAGATWSLNHYTINNSSQSAWNDATEADLSSEFNKFVDKITALEGNGTVISAPTELTAGFPLYLQNDSPSSILMGGMNEEKYPEGKVWVINTDVTISSSFEYSGLGTIIIANGGNLTINNGVNIIPVTPSVDKLGIIAYGNITLGGNNKIQAMAFTKGDFDATGATNIEWKGSIVANHFIVTGSANVRFFYDYNSVDKVPPGFRYLNLPASKETGNTGN